MKLNKGVCISLLFTLFIGLSGCGSQHQSQSNSQQKAPTSHSSGSGSNTKIDSNSKAGSSSKTASDSSSDSNPNSGKNHAPPPTIQKDLKDNVAGAISTRVPLMLPTSVPVSKGKYLTATTHSETWYYNAKLYETNKQVNINTTAASSGKEIAMIAGTEYKNAPEAQSHISGYVQTHPTKNNSVDLGNGITASQKTETGHHYYSWNEGRWSIKLDSPSDPHYKNKNYPNSEKLAESIVSYLHTHSLPTPENIGVITIHNWNHSTLTTVQWQYHEMIYQVSSHNPYIALKTAVTVFRLSGSSNKPSTTARKPTGSSQDSSGSTQSSSGIVDHMTLDEKIGQMIMVGVNGTYASSQARTLINDYHAGGVILFGKNIHSPQQTVHLINQLKEMNSQAGNPVPLFFSVDQEGGRVQRLPANITRIPSNGTIGKIDDPQYSHEIGQVIGEELKNFGFNMDFAPVLGINTYGSHSVIGDRSFGSDKYTVSHLGTATMKGIQSQQVISVVKHFPGYGAVTDSAETDLPRVNLGMNHLMNIEWYPFKTAIASGADTIMVTHILLPKLDPHDPASMSHTIITGMLRDKLGFHGVVITDDMTMGAITKHYSVSNAAVQAVKAGADIVLVAFNPKEQESAFQALKSAVQKGDISMNRINESVRRIIHLKQKYHLSNQMTPNVNVDRINQKIKTVLEKK